MIEALKRAFGKKAAPAAKSAAPAAPAPAIEVEDTEAYSSAAAEEIINRLCDQLAASQAQVRALAQTNQTLTGHLKAANIAIGQLNKMPKNKYWNQRAGK
jgi:hypothetical protein